MSFHQALFESTYEWKKEIVARKTIHWNYHEQMFVFPLIERNYIYDSHMYL